MEPDAAAALRGHDVVYLRAAPEVLAARLEHDARPTTVTARSSPTTRGPCSRSSSRPRDERYRELATLVVDASRDAARVVDEIMAALGPAPAR